MALIDAIMCVYFVVLLYMYIRRDIILHRMSAAGSIALFLLLRNILFYLDFGLQENAILFAGIIFHFIRIERVHQGEKGSDFGGFFEDFSSIVEKNNNDLAKLLDHYNDLERYVEEQFDRVTMSVLNQLTRQIKGHKAFLSKPRSRAIVVTGEVSAGKSSLINPLVGKDILPMRHGHSTAAICRIYDNETKHIIPYEKDQSGNIKPLQPVFPSTDAELKKEIENLATSELGQPPFEYIDIFLPIAFLKPPLYIVDTPGIGENDRFDNHVIDYLPQAAGFIYVVNAGNAGGVLNHGIRDIMRAVKEYRNKVGTLPFDHNCAIFVFNKWDSIPEDEKEEIQQKNDSKLSEIWENYNPDQSICFSVRKHGPTQRKALQEMIDGMVRRSLTSQFDMYKSWLQNFLTEVINTAESHLHHLRQTPGERRENVEKVSNILDDMDRQLKMYAKRLTTKASQWAKTNKDTVHLVLFPNDSKKLRKMYTLSKTAMDKIDDISDLEHAAAANFDRKIKEEIDLHIKTSLQKEEFKSFLQEMKEEQTAVLQKLTQLDFALTNTLHPVGVKSSSLDHPNKAHITIAEVLKQAVLKIKNWLALTLLPKSKKDNLVNEWINQLVLEMDKSFLCSEMEQRLQQQLKENLGASFEQSMTEFIQRRRETIRSLSAIDILALNTKFFKTTVEAAKDFLKKVDTCGSSPS